MSTQRTDRNKTRAVLIALGSNVEPEVNMPLALERLRAIGGLLSVSTCYRSAAIDCGGTASELVPDFANAAVKLLTQAAPRELKFEYLRPIEEALGRRRSGDRFAPRPIDLDIALYEDSVLKQEGLEIPDPQIEQHAYLAVPLAEVAPGWLHPVSGRPLEDLAAEVDRNGLVPTRWNGQPLSRAT